jgi:hypothetical protein
MGIKVRFVYKNNNLINSLMYEVSLLEKLLIKVESVILNVMECC